MKLTDAGTVPSRVHRSATIVTYVLVWVVYYVLLHASGIDGSVPRPSPAALVLAVEAIKLVMAAVSFLMQEGLSEWPVFVRSPDLCALVLQYLPVAGLYAVYNNLMISNLRLNNPTTYLVLANSRLIMTAVVWQRMFGKTVSNLGKVALSLITFGIFLSTDWAEPSSGADGKHYSDERAYLTIFPPAVWIVTQMACAVMASVYNEKLLKKHVKCSVHLQNISLYLNSIVINLFMALLHRDHSGNNVPSDLKALLQPMSLAIIITLATGGIMSSLVLRNENSVTKGVASASETIFTAIFEWSYLGSRPNLRMVAAILLVSLGAFLYGNQGLAFGKIRRVPQRLKIRYIWAILVFVQVLNTLYFQSSVHLSATFPVLPASYIDTCTKPTPEPTRISETKLRRIQDAQDVMACIVTELKKQGAPVTINFGTVLHEFRNGTTTPCFWPRATDKDIDLAVFESHFFLVIQMKKNIERLFGWTITTDNQERQRLFLQFTPFDDTRKRGLPTRDSFQLDIYGFKCSQFDDFIYFPWDKVTVRKDAFLPLRPHKSIQTKISNNSRASFHMPFNSECLLANMYGSDFMTPKEGHFIRKKAYDDPVCNQGSLDAAAVEALYQQLSFCGDSTPETKDGLVKAAKTISNSTSDLLVGSRATAEDTMSSFGAVACLRNREDVAHALALARDMSAREDLSLGLEIFHQGTLSQFLTAKLESFSSVMVIDVREIPGSCYAAALSVTKIKHIMLVNPSVVLLTSNSTQQEELPRFRPGSCSVTSTSHELDAVLANVEQSRSSRCRMLFHSRTRSVPVGPIFSDLNGKSHRIGTINTPAQVASISAYFNPTRSDRDWIAHFHHLPLFQSELASKSYIPLHPEFSQQVQTKLQHYLAAQRNLFLDRQVGWVAFDGGLVSQPMTNEIEGSDNDEPYCHSFNDLGSAKRSLRVGGGSQRVLLNVDLVSTADGVPVAMHKNDAFGPIDFTRNRPLEGQFASDLNWTDASTVLHNPCFPMAVAQTWFRKNEYHGYGSFTDSVMNLRWKKVTRVEEIIDTLIHREGARIIFDLKAPSFKGQLDQALYISRFIKRSSHKLYQNEFQQKVALRFFSDQDSAASVLPYQAVEAIESGNIPLEFEYYVNAPFKMACLQIAKWARRFNVKLAGCFIIENHVAIAESWDILSRTLNFTSNGTLPQVRPNLICDVPRKQEKPNTSLWQDGLISCIENGYEWIHHPFAVSASADHSVPKASLAFPTASVELLSHPLQAARSRYVSSERANASNATMLSTWDNYFSHWGYTTPYDWELQRQRLQFRGSTSENYNPQVGKLLTFRCITKVLTVLLFLRLEEIGLLSIDDEITERTEGQKAVAWRHVFSNTAGADGSLSGTSFEYSNSFWKHVADTVENATGLSFQEAIEVHILGPMGLTGKLDTDTPYPPFTARGFLGSIDDLLLIGSTLANGGVSPKTRRQVVSISGVGRLLGDNVPDREQFLGDKTVRTMDRFLERKGDDHKASGNSTFPFGVVEGYGLGLWCVKGWRSISGSEPVRGWLLMGSSEALLYFDTTGLVVGMIAAQRVMGLELTAPFSQVVRRVGAQWEENLLGL